MLITETPGAPITFRAVGPWNQRDALQKALGGPINSTRELPSKAWLVGCTSTAQQAALARRTTLPGGFSFTASIPVPTVDGVITGIPKGDHCVRQVQEDLTRDNVPVVKVLRLNNRKGEESGAVRITFRATKLPEKVWIGATTYPVSPFNSPVRRCTKCQRIGHVKKMCHAKKACCSRCGCTDHTDGAACTRRPSCINCNGEHSAAFRKCPEMIIRANANLIRSAKYIPYSEALRMAREQFSSAKPAASVPGLADNPPQGWGPDRQAGSNPLTDPSVPCPPSFADMAKVGLVRQPMTFTASLAMANGNGVRSGRVAQRGAAQIQSSQGSKNTSQKQTPTKKKNTKEGPKSSQSNQTKNNKGITPSTGNPGLRPGETSSQKSDSGTSKGASRAPQVKSSGKSFPLPNLNLHAEVTPFTITDLHRTEGGSDEDKRRDIFLRWVWDILYAFVKAKTEGNLGQLLNHLTQVYNSVTKEDQLPPLVTKIMDIFAVLAGFRGDLLPEHMSLPDGQMGSQAASDANP